MAVAKLPKVEARREAQLRREVFAAAKAKRSWTLALWALRSQLPLAPSLQVVGAAVNGCAKGTQWRWAQELLLSLDAVRLQRNLVLYNSILDSSQRDAAANGRSASRWPWSLQILRSLKCQQLEADVVSYSSGLRGLRGLLGWRWALQLFQALGDMANDFSFNSCISVLGPTAWDRAAEVFLQIFQRAQLPDVVGFTASLAAAPGDAWAQALQRLQEMQDVDVLPNSATVNSIIETCERSLQWQLALWLLHRADLPTTAVTYSATMMTCSQSSFWQLALQLLAELQANCRLRVDLVAFGSGLAAVELGRCWRTGLDILQRISLAQVLPSVVVYASALGSCEWPWALQLLGRMQQNHGLEADLVTMTSALLSLADAAQWQRALELLRHGEGVANSLSYFAVLRACEDRHKHLQVLSLFPTIHDLTMATLRHGSQWSEF